MNWSRNTAIVAIGLVFLTVACSSGDDAQADTSSGDAASTPQGQAAARTYTLQQEVPMAIFVTTTALRHTGFLQKEFTCEGSNASPYLGWEGAPEGTQSYAIVAEDVDAEEGEFAHWLIWGIPADLTELSAGASGSGGLPPGSVEGVNGFESTGWRGPCPPPRVIGSTSVSAGVNRVTPSTGIRSHLYLISVYALDTQLELDSSAEMPDLLRAIDGHILAGGTLETKYISSVTIR